MFIIITGGTYGLTLDFITQQPSCVNFLVFEPLTTNLYSPSIRTETFGSKAMHQNFPVVLSFPVHNFSEKTFSSRRFIDKIHIRARAPDMKEKE